MRFRKCGGSRFAEGAMPFRGSLLSELDINKDGKVTRQEVEVMRSGLVDSAPDVAQVAQKAAAEGGGTGRGASRV